MYVPQLYSENNGVKNPLLFSSLPLVYSTVMYCGESNMNLSCKTCHYSAESWLGNSWTVSISQWNVPVAKISRVERIWVCTGTLFVCYVGFSRSGMSCWQRSANIALGKWIRLQWATHLNQCTFYVILLYTVDVHLVVSTIVSDYSVIYAADWLTTSELWAAPHNQLTMTTITVFYQ